MGLIVSWCLTFASFMEVFITRFEAFFLIYWYRKSHPSGLKFHYFISNIEFIGIKTNAILPVYIAWPVCFSIWRFTYIIFRYQLYFLLSFDTHTLQEIGIWILKDLLSCITELSISLTVENAMKLMGLITQ